MHDEVLSDFHKIVADLIVAHRGDRNVVTFVEDLAQAREKFLKRLQQLRYENPNLAAECSLCEKSILRAANDAMHRARETGRVTRDFQRENNITSFRGADVLYKPHSMLARASFKSIARQKDNLTRRAK
jgi:aerobic-type carbon monoxide dehydrogenase small subunit (CoxS/CutS family)